MTAIEFCNLKAQYQAYQNEIDAAMQKVLEHGRFIMGPEITELENELVNFVGCDSAITCSNGSDALLLAFMALGLQPGDEIITTPFTFFSTVSMISFFGLKPVFVDIAEDSFNIDVAKISEKISKKTKMILPVSLYGQPADMDEIQAIAQEKNLVVLEDAAQSFGAEYKGKKSCNLTEIATTSFFPAKPLGCYGDGGAVFTNNPDWSERLKTLRVHGQTQRYQHESLGMNARMDTIQAAILLVKLQYFTREIEKRKKIAAKYDEALQGFVTPHVKQDRTSVYAQYTLRLKNRNHVREELKKQGVPTAVHYPIPLHLQPAFQFLQYQLGDFPVAEQASQEVLSLPMSAFVTDAEIQKITTVLRQVVS